ncbi:MAG: response regulator [Magnetococcales bacterium]|nr:response regulator [Magnetococcales bacterium]
MRPSILIVDDVAVNLHFLHVILQDHYQVSFATSGRQALELIERRRPDLVLLDLGLPDLDGAEVWRQIRSRPQCRDLPVIFITAREAEEGVSGALAEVERLVKPVEADALLIAIRAHLGRLVSENPEG